MTNEIKQRIEQIKKGEVPQGYKKTKVGIVPSEWDNVHFKKMFSRLMRKNSEGNSNVLTISAQQGLISQQEFFNKSIASEDKRNYYLLNKGEFAYNKSYSNGYPFGALKPLTRYEKGVVSPLYICFKKTQENSCPDYYNQYFEAGLMNHEIKAIAQEGARNHGLLNISVDDFFNTYIILPPLPEQEKIASILTTCDKVIELKQKLIIQKQSLKKYLMQTLLTGKKRLKGFTGEWGKVALGECLSIKSIKQLPTEKEPLMAFIAGEGVSHKGDRYDRSALVKDENKLYKRTDLYDFIYSSNNLLVGSIGLNLYGSAVISDVYEIFKAKKNFNIIFLNALIENPRVLHNIVRFRQGVIYGQYRIHADDFLSVNVNLPPLPEQTAIAEILSTADKEIELLQKQLDEEKAKKKALMQLLLTGIVRVKI
jgi:type I restriction enzyme S subunit